MAWGRIGAIFYFVGKIPVAKDWFFMLANGLVKAGLKNFKNLTEIPSMPQDVFAIKEEMFLSTSYWVIKVNVKDVSILLVMYAQKTFYFCVYNVGQFWTDSNEEFIKAITYSLGICYCARVYNDFIESVPLINRFTDYFRYSFPDGFDILIFLEYFMVIVYFSFGNHTF